MGGNYEKNLFRHLEETLEKVDHLTDEVAALKRAHKTEISSMKQEYGKEISKLKATYQKDIDSLKIKVEVLSKENQTLKAENTKLRDIINKNSGNSSKPPSTDGFKKIHNSREKSGKRPGGQAGHKGCVPKLFENPTCVVKIKTKKCKCGGHIQYRDKYSAKQLVDIQILTDITEYREYEGVCDYCLRKVKNRAPINDVITYGNALKSLSAMLTIEGCVSISRAQQMIMELTDATINLSEGTIVKWNKTLAGCVVPAVDKIKENLLVTPVLNKDETGIRVGKTMRWFHVLGSKTNTLFCAHKKRGNDADKEMDILPSYSGVLVHDHLKGLYNFTCEHAECNAHILRYLKAAVESRNREWADNMIRLLLEAKAGGEESDIFRRYDDILEQGQMEFLQDEASDYNGEDMKLLRRMKKYKQEHLRFVINKNVPFDNNQAERDLRMIKAKTKISGCFRGEDGGEIFAVLKSYTSTLRKNGLNIFGGIKRAFDGTPVLCSETKG